MLFLVIGWNEVNIASGPWSGISVERFDITVQVRVVRFAGLSVLQLARGKSALVLRGSSKRPTFKIGLFIIVSHRMSLLYINQFFFFFK